ncbi:peptidase C15 pyroglutamyl peptidase I-like protein [Phanerochaete sordida]|uniref:Peptidase C15 pyroglutamyl peptidase I-like protein n=1 Tax=Phanerochaete sordida TaxID=48140 RepID=A0A9P3GT89_9APHY|nr:peptidase C15 pyroglutamyl peptidase I-like protein [Phanerochaete sordida]
MAPTDPTPAPDIVHVLVTGFGPFGNFPVNPSWLAVKALAGASLPTTTARGHARTVRITVLEVPVEYAAVLAVVPGLHAAPPVLPANALLHAHGLPAAGFDFILHVGVAGPGGLALERRGHKLGYLRPDAAGALAPAVGATRGFAAGYEGLPAELETQADVAGLQADLLASGVEHVRVSEDAGHYLCDFICYASLAQARRGEEKGVKTPLVQFLHCCPVDQPYATEQVTEAIKHIVTWVGAGLASGSSLAALQRPVRARL